MSHEFSDAEMYYCDFCGEYMPIETMYELQDGRIVCEDCLTHIEEEESHHHTEWSGNLPG